MSRIITSNQLKQSLFLKKLLRMPDITDDSIRDLEMKLDPSLPDYAEHKQRYEEHLDYIKISEKAYEFQRDVHIRKDPKYANLHNKYTLGGLVLTGKFKERFCRNTMNINFHKKAIVLGFVTMGYATPIPNSRFFK